MSEQRVHEEAATWFARMASDEADWPGFTAWLEADPRQIDPRGLLHLLDEHQRAVLVRQRGVQRRQPQLLLGPPHRIEIGRAHV